MIKIGFAGVWVHDQDEALAFYTEKLGWELRADVTLPELGNYRWLIVGPPGQPEVSLVLRRDPRAGGSRRRDGRPDQKPHGQGVGRKRPTHHDRRASLVRGAARLAGSSSPSRPRNGPMESIPRSATRPGTSSA